MVHLFLLVQIIQLLLGKLENHTLNTGASYQLEWCFTRVDNFASGGCECTQVDNIDVSYTGVTTAAKSVEAHAVDGGADITITEGSGASSYLIVRGTSEISFTPTDTTAYPLGSVGGGEEVVYNGASNTFSDTGLTNGQEYHYAIFAADGSNNYTVPTTTSVISSVAPVSTFSAEKDDGAIDLSWAIEAGSVSGYLLVRQQGSEVSFTPTDGVVYSVSSQTGGDVIYRGTSTSLRDSGLTNGERYFYSIWTYNGSNEYSKVVATADQLPEAYPSASYGGATWYLGRGSKAVQTFAQLKV